MFYWWSKLVQSDYVLSGIVWGSSTNPSLLTIYTTSMQKSVIKKKSNEMGQFDESTIIIIIGSYVYDAYNGNDSVP